MSSNQITQARSMNGILDFDGVENLNVDNIDAKNIDVENLEIETNLKVNNTDISPTELSFLDNTTSNIQTQIDNINTNISDNLVTKTGEQEISGNKNFSGTTTFSGDISANSITITPAELATLEGISTTQTIQEQLDNAGISNAMTLNTQQVANGQKTFTQPVGLPSVNYDDTNGTFTGFMSSPTTLTYSNLDGVFSVANSIINGTGVSSAITSATTRAGTDAGEIVLTTSGTATSSVGSVDGYLTEQQQVINGVTRNVFVFENVNNITQKTNNLYVSALRWNTTSSVTTPVYTDDFVEYVNYPNLPVNSIILESNSVSTMQPNKTIKSGYIYDTNTFISLNSLIVGDFLEGTGLTKPVKITAQNNNSYTLTSPNTITPSTSINTIQGYFNTSNTIYYYSKTGTSTIGNFLTGTNLTGEGNITAIDLNDKELTIQDNTFVSTPDRTKTGYIQNASSIVFQNLNNIQVGQFVEESSITLGKHYITSITNTIATLGDLNTPLTPSSTPIDGYLFSSNVLVGTGYTLNNYITHPTDILDPRTRVSVINPTFVNLDVNNNIPTPNNKTYDGFSTSSTEFYYNNNNTNVAINYYLKDNNISAPTINHLITSVDTQNRKLTTANLPVSSPNINVNGYVNNTLNKIIITSAQSISVGDGIDTTLINNSTRFVSSVNGTELGVSGTLNPSPVITDLEGFVTGNSTIIAYDPNNRLILNNFLINTSGNTMGSINSTISTITNLNNDFKQVNFSSSSGTSTSYNTFDSLKTTSGQIFINTSPVLSLTTKYSATYSGSLKYGRLSSYVSGTINGYTTNETSSVSPSITLDNAINIKLDNGSRVVLFGALKPNLVSSFLNKVFTYSGYSAGTNFLKVTTSQNSTIQNGYTTTTPVNFSGANNYVDFNYTDAINYNNVNLISGSETYGYVYEKNGYYFWIQHNTGSAINYQYQDYIIERVGTPLVDRYTAKNTAYTGMWIDNATSGTAYSIGFSVSNPPQVHKTGAERGLLLVAQTYNANVTQFLVNPVFPNANPATNDYVFSGSGTTYHYATITNVTSSGGNKLITLNQSFYVGAVNSQILCLYQVPNGANQFFVNVAGLRPANQLANFITTQTISVAQTQETFQSITPTNVDIYSIPNFYSYNSYEKKTFQQITPINFQVFNTQSINEFSSINYDNFEKLNFSIFALDTFLAQTSVNVGFKSTLITNDTFVTTTEFTNGIDNPLLKAPTIANGDNATYPTFTGAVINYTGTNATKSYSSSLRIRHNQEQFNNVTFNQTNTTFDKDVIFSENTTFNDDATFNDNVIVNNVSALFNVKIRSPNQPVWYYTGGSGNQNYGAGSRIGSYSYTGGYSATRSFNLGSLYNTTHNAFNNQNGAFYATEGTGVYKVDLYVFCNNATSFNGRISLQTNAGRNQGGQFNMSVNRNTSTENCTLLSWTWTATSTAHYCYFYTHSSVLTAYLGVGHTGLRVTKLM